MKAPHSFNYINSIDRVIDTHLLSQLCAFIKKVTFHVSWLPCQRPRSSILFTSCLNINEFTIYLLHNSWSREYNIQRWNCLRTYSIFQNSRYWTYAWFIYWITLSSTQIFNHNTSDQYYTAKHIYIFFIINHPMHSTLSRIVIVKVFFF